MICIFFVKELLIETLNGCRRRLALKSNKKKERDRRSMSTGNDSNDYVARSVHEYHQNTERHCSVWRQFESKTIIDGILLTLYSLFALCMFCVVLFAVVHLDVSVGAHSLGVFGRTEWSTHSLPFHPLSDCLYISCTHSPRCAVCRCVLLWIVLFFVCSRRVPADLCAL